jgi:hypothetical protein
MCGASPDLRRRQGRSTSAEKWTDWVALGELQVSNVRSLGAPPPVDNTGPSVRPRPPGAASMQPRSVPRRTQERRRGLIVGCSMLLVAALIAVAAVVATGSPKSVSALNPPPVTTAASDSDLRIAKITKDLDGKGCSQQVFDNQTGRMRQSQLPCEATAFDSNGVPVPVGTIHRLDAISKSFPGH